MGILNLRNLPDDLHRALRVRAAAAGRSMEAEAQLILAQALTIETTRVSASDLQSYVRELFGGELPPPGQVEEFLAERRREAACS